uniref:Uncharacterized protein n=1 Tax=Romanomermis culicivorax TaxID=13658 RepID=A0A915JYH6_ROMCU
MQQQIVDAQKVDPMLDQTGQKVENQVKGFYTLYNILHREGSKVHKLSALFEYTSTESELPYLCILIDISKLRLIVWCRPFTPQFE